MTAEIRHDTRHDIGLAALARGTGFGRAGGGGSLVERREAAQRRLSSTVRAAELIECALRGFDEAMTEHCIVDHQESLRPTVRALLGLAYGVADYDVTILPASVDAAVRVRHTPFGPEAEVVDLAAVDGEAVTTITSPAPLVPAAPPPTVSARTTSAAVPDGAGDDGTTVLAVEPASPWWTEGRPPADPRQPGIPT